MSNYLEMQLFDWSEWDEVGESVLVFGNVSLNVQVGEHPAGTKFKCAVFDMKESLLILQAENGEEFTYPLLLSVGERIR
jgi:hypothetical protein